MHNASEFLLHSASSYALSICVLLTCAMQKYAFVLRCIIVSTERFYYAKTKTAKNEQGLLRNGAREAMLAYSAINRTAIACPAHVDVFGQTQAEGARESLSSL